MEVKCVANKFKPPEEIGWTSPHKTSAVFTYIGKICGNASRQLWTSAALQWSHKSEMILAWARKFVYCAEDACFAMRLETKGVPLLSTRVLMQPVLVNAAKPNW